MCVCVNVCMVVCKWDEMTSCVWQTPYLFVFHNLITWSLDENEVADGQGLTIANRDLSIRSRRFPIRNSDVSIRNNNLSKNHGLFHNRECLFPHSECLFLINKSLLASVRQLHNRYLVFIQGWWAWSRRPNPMLAFNMSCSYLETSM